MITLQLPDSDPSNAGVLQGDSQPGLGGELQCSADEVSAQFLAVQHSSIGDIVSE